MEEELLKITRGVLSTIKAANPGMGQLAVRIAARREIGDWKIICRVASEMESRGEL